MECLTDDSCFSLGSDEEPKASVPKRFIADVSSIEEQTTNTSTIIRPKAQSTPKLPLEQVSYIDMFDGKNNLSATEVDATGAKTKYLNVKGVTPSISARNKFTKTTVFDWSTFNTIEVGGVEYEFKINQVTYEKLRNMTGIKELDTKLLIELSRSIVTRTNGLLSKEATIAIINKIIEDQISLLVTLTNTAESHLVQTYNALVRGDITTVKDRGLFAFFTNQFKDLIHATFGDNLTPEELLGKFAKLQ